MAFGRGVSRKARFSVWFLEMHIPDTGSGKRGDRRARLTTGNKRGAISGKELRLEGNCCRKRCSTHIAIWLFWKKSHVY